MKVDVSNTNPESKFPKLMQLPSSGTIILATERHNGSYIGTVITSNSYNSGEYSRVWCSDFVDFNGSVTLSNS